jgi:hypothetical protein
MVMGYLTHLRAPDEIENGELRRSVEHLDSGAPGLSKGIEDLSRGADRS